jgi:hypothetical protein
MWQKKCCQGTTDRIGSRLPDLGPKKGPDPQNCNDVHVRATGLDPYTGTNLSPANLNSHFHCTQKITLFSITR